MLTRVPIWAAGLAGFLAAAEGHGQTAFINDTNTAIILWVPEQSPAGRQVFSSPASRAGVLSAERSGIGVGVQGYGTAIKPQANPPPLGQQANQPTIGQQGAPSIPSLTNQFVPGLPTNVPPMVPQATNGNFAAQNAAGFWTWYPTERVWVWTSLSGAAAGMQNGADQQNKMGFQPGTVDQQGKTVLPGTAIGPVRSFPPVLPPGRPPQLVPNPGPFPGSGTAVGGSQSSPGQGSGSGSGGSAGSGGR